MVILLMLVVLVFGWKPAFDWKQVFD